MATVCIFAGARGKAYLYPNAAWIARELVKSGNDLIYGGSSKGIMGAICTAAKQERTRSITGVLPEKVAALRHYDPEIDMIVAMDMHERKREFWDRSDAYLCLPGGVGTLDELYEIWTLSKLGYVDPIKPIVVYNQNGFYDPLIKMTQNMILHGTMPEEKAGLVTFVSTPWEAVQKLTEKGAAVQ